MAIEPIEITNPAEQRRVFKKLKQDNDADLKMEMATLVDGPAEGTELLIPHGVFVLAVEAEGGEYSYIRSARRPDTFMVRRDRENYGLDEVGV